LLHLVGINSFEYLGVFKELFQKIDWGLS